jgi:uncharacterized membrane protein
MLSRRIDLTTELPISDILWLEDRVPDVFLATGERGYLIPPSRITLRDNVEDARKEAERIRNDYVLIAFEPERRSEAIEAMKCPFIDAISFTLETARMINKGLIHVARVNKKAIEIRFEGDISGISGMLKARHRLTVRYVPIYFGSGAKRKDERVDQYALRGFMRRIIKYDLLSISARNQRDLFFRNANRLEYYELANGVRSINNIPKNDDDRHGGTQSNSRTHLASRPCKHIGSQRRRWNILGRDFG